MVKKRRQTRGVKHYAHQHPETHQGIRNGNAKLTDAKVREIWKLHTKLTQDELAVLLGVSQTAVNNVLCHRNWTHIPGEK